MKKKTLAKKDGSALLVAIIIMAVVMMLSLALMLVSFNLYATASRQQNMAQCKELAQSLSKELRSEVTIPPFDSYADQRAAYEAGRYPIWFYLRYNIWQSSWVSYDAELPGQTAKFAHRYFKLTPSDSASDAAQLMDNISILMYWEAEEGADKTDTELIVQVSCEKGKQKSVITTTYVLNVAEKLYEDAPAEDEDPFNSAVNPKRNTIKPGEIWSWGEGTME